MSSATSTSERPVHPVSTEGRVARRRWKQAAAARWATLQRLFDHDGEVNGAVREFSRASGGNRMRSWLTLRRAFEGLAHLERVVLEGRSPFALWSAVHVPADGSSVYAPTDARELTDSEMQSGGEIHYLMFGRFLRAGDTRKMRAARGLWSLSASDHALGRMAMRGEADIDGALLGAHHALLTAPMTIAEELVTGGSFMVPAGSGAFACTAGIHKAAETGTPIMLIRARTWLDSDQLSDSQVAQAARLWTPRLDEVPMGLSVLLPGHLRREPKPSTISDS